MDNSSEANPIKSNKQRTAAMNIDDLAIFFIPILVIVGSTKNQWPIIISEKMLLTSVMGKIVQIKFSKPVLNALVIKTIKLVKKDRWFKLLLLCSNTDPRTAQPANTNRLKFINKITEITPMNSMLKPFLGLVEYLMYQK